MPRAVRVALCAHLLILLLLSTGTAAANQMLAPLLAGPHETFVQLNASTSLSCLFLVGSPNANPSDVIVQWSSGGQDLTFQSFVYPTSATAAFFRTSTAILALNGTHSLLNYSLLVQSARPEFNADFGCRSGATPANAFLNVEAPPGSPSLSPVPSGAPFIEGSNASLLCVSFGGNPPPALSFTKSNADASAANWTSAPTSTASPTPAAAWSSATWGSASSSFGSVQAGGASNFSATSATLTWTPSAEDHGAIVSCSASAYSHALGHVNALTSTYTLDVRYKPRVTFVWPGHDAAAAASTLYVHEGAALALQCAADANPAAVAWSWSWSNASNATAAPASASATLVLAALSRAAAGTYGCEASNDVGAAAASLHVAALYPPALQLNASYTVTENEALTLTCNVSSADPAAAAPGLELLAYAWLFSPLASEAPLPAGAANQTLNWTGNAIKLQPDRSRAGLYYCTVLFNASDDLGVHRTLVSSAATRLFVQYTPNTPLLSTSVAGFPAAPSRTASIQLLLGQPFSANCSLASTSPGYPNPSLAWNVPASASYSTSTANGTPTASLSVAALTFDHSGTYTCSASNTAGVSAATLVITVLGAAFSRTLPPTTALNVSASLSSPLQVTCAVCTDALSAAPAVGWWHDGVKIEPLDENSRFSVTASRTTSVASTAYWLSNTSYESTCPQLYSSALQWRGAGRAGNALDGPSDFGNYSCAFSSSTSANSQTQLWGASSTMALLLSFVPLVSAPIPIIGIDLKSNVQLLCSVTAYPPASIQWTSPRGDSWTATQSATSAISTSASTLLLQSQQQFGSYRCSASNAVGAASATLQLRAQSVPDAPTDLSLVAASAETLAVQWLRPFDGSRNVSLNFTVYATVAGASRSSSTWTCDWPLYSACSLTLQQLMPSTTYTAYVTASNWLGTSKASNALVLLTSDMPRPELTASYDAASGVLSLSIVPPSGSSISQVLQTYCLQVTYASVSSGASSAASDCLLLNASSVQLSQLNVQLSPRAALCLIRRHDICSSSAPIAVVAVTSPWAPDLPIVWIYVVAGVCAAVLLVLLVVCVVCCLRACRARSRSRHMPPSRSVKSPAAHFAQDASPINGATRQKQPYEQYSMAPEQPFPDPQQQQVMFVSGDYRDALDDAGMGIALQQFAPVYPYDASLYMQHSLDANDLSVRQPPAVSFAGLSFLPQQQAAPLAAVAAPHANYANNNNNHLACAQHAHDVNRSSLDSGLSTDSPNAQQLLLNGGGGAGPMPMQVQQLLVNGQPVQLMGVPQAFRFAAEALPAAELYQLQNVPPPASTSMRSRRDHRANNGSNPRLPGSGRSTPLPPGVAVSAAAAAPLAASHLQHCPNCPCYHCIRAQSLQHSRPLTPLFDSDSREPVAAAPAAGSHSTSGRGSNEERSLEEAHTLQTFGRVAPSGGSGSAGGDSQSQDPRNQIVEVVV